MAHVEAPKLILPSNFTKELQENSHLVDNCIQNFHLQRYIVGSMVGNLVLP